MRLLQDKRINRVRFDAAIMKHQSNILEFCSEVLKNPVESSEPLSRTLLDGRSVSGSLTRL